MLITPEILLKAYAIGVFPMAESADDSQLFWIDPEQRGILPLDGFHVPRRLKRTLRSRAYEIRIDSDFGAVIEGCAGPAPGRWSTWINEDIRSLYGDLFEMGYCHTVECWMEGELAGGLYGISLGSAFFGESMFSRRTDASKIALVHLVARLRAGGFTLLDTQFVTDHLARFGVVEIPKNIYKARLEEAMERSADFLAFDQDASPEAVLQSTSQTS